MRKNLITAIGVALLSAVVPVAGITFGIEDIAGGPSAKAPHSSTANYWIFSLTNSSQQLARCTGVLVAPRVVLTAAHCQVDGGDTTAYRVSFSDPAVRNDTGASINGTFYPHPKFVGNQGLERASDSYDLAVILLNKDAPVNATKFAKLPPKGYYDKIGTTSKAISVNGKGITMVGYGFGERITSTQGQPDFTNQNSRGVPIPRKYSFGTVLSVENSIIRISQNPARGDAGACYGDSGGPNFVGSFQHETDIVAALTSTGDAVCRATNAAYRLDTEVAHEFLAQYNVPLPL